MQRDLPTAFRSLIAASLLIAVSVTLLVSVSTLRKAEMVAISYQAMPR